MIQSLTPELAKAFDLPEDIDGVVVAKVQEESPAAKAGLKRGDVITKFKGKKVGDANQLRNAVAQQSPGDEVNVSIRRDGESQTMTVKLGALHGEGGGSGAGSDVMEGLSLGTVNSETRSAFELPRQLDKGVVVTDIKPNTPAARTGLQPGDVILEVNRREVASIEEFADIYNTSKGRILVLLYRDGNTLFAPIPKP
jgi:S1-C subfamily serine protease